MTPRDIWIRIATFVAVTYAFSSIFMYMVVSSGEITVVAAFGGMWSPFVGVLVTRLIFPDGRRRGSLAGLGWGWGKTRYQVLSYVLPIVYVGAAYAVVWLTGIGRFTDTAPGTVAMWALKNVGTGLVTATILAFGEEVGRQGFLVPQLYRITDFTKTALLEMGALSAVAFLYSGGREEIFRRRSRCERGRCELARPTGDWTSQFSGFIILGTCNQPSLCC